MRGYIIGHIIGGTRRGGGQRLYLPVVPIHLRRLVERCSVEGTRCLLQQAEGVGRSVQVSSVMSAVALVHVLR